MLLCSGYRTCTNLSHFRDRHFIFSGPATKPPPPSSLVATFFGSFFWTSRRSFFLIARPRTFCGFFVPLILIILIKTFKFRNQGCFNEHVVNKDTIRANVKWNRKFDYLMASTVSLRGAAVFEIDILVSLKLSDKTIVNRKHEKKKQW